MVAPLKFDEILKALVDDGVEFILVGGVAAVLEAAPFTTLETSGVGHDPTADRIAR
jgi:hypothetical protein